MATTRCKPVMAAAIVIGVVLSASASAGAATVSVEAGVLSFSAGQGELNQVRIERVATFFRVRDDTAPLSTADADCTELDAHLTRCLAAPVDEVEVLARDQNDAITFIGAKPATISGGQGTDTIQSGEGDDTLSAGAGSVSSTTGDGIFGGPGDDVVRGSTSASSSTFISAGPGDDTLIGGPGFTSMSGGPDADEFRGGSGSDQVSYSDSPAEVSVTINNVANDGVPGENDDVRTDVENVVGSSFADVINGSPRPESLSGSSGADTLRGFAGDDFLVGGEDGDTLSAGEGRDTMQGGFGTPAPDTFLGGPDVDRVLYSDRPDASPLSLTLDDVANDGSVGEGDNIRSDVENVEGGPGPDTIVGSVEDNELKGDDDDDTINGAGGDDILRGDDNSGSPGDDDLNGGGADDILFGGPAGNDDFRGSAGFDTVTYSEVSSPTVITVDDAAGDGPAGESDNVRTDVESVFGSPAADDITGSSGAEVLFGFSGTDTLDGAGGDDLLEGEGPAFIPLEADVLIGGAGIDGVTYASHFSPIAADIDDLADDGAAGENDRVRTSVENLFGGPSNDTLTGSADANLLEGGPGSGSDVINGLGGPDVIAGGFAFDTLSGASGNDRIHSRDDLTDNVDCGPNTDWAEADSVDTLANCENVFNPRPLVPTSRGGPGTELEAVWKASKRRLARATEAADRAR